MVFTVEILPRVNSGPGTPLVPRGFRLDKPLGSTRHPGGGDTGATAVGSSPLLRGPNLYYKDIIIISSRVSLVVEPEKVLIKFYRSNSEEKSIDPFFSISIIYSTEFLTIISTRIKFNVLKRIRLKNISIYLSIYIFIELL